MTVQVHTTSVESLDMAIDAGVDIVTHGDISGPQVPIPDETLRKLVDRDIPVSVLPITQRRIDAYAEIHPRVPGAILAPYMKVGRENQKAMIEHGVTMLLSTDAGVENPVVAAESEGPHPDPRTKLGEGHFNALAGLEELGMAPQEILRSATSHIAAAYRVDDRLGTLEPGKAGDIVVLGNDPLQSAAHYREIEMVIKDGAVVDLDALPVAPADQFDSGAGGHARRIGVPRWGSCRLRASIMTDGPAPKLDGSDVHTDLETEVQAVGVRIGRTRTRARFRSTTTNAPEARSASCCVSVVATTSARCSGRTSWDRTCITLGPPAPDNASIAPKSKS